MDLISSQEEQGGGGGGMCALSCSLEEHRFLESQ